VRVFIAIDLDPHIKTNLTGFLTHLKNLGRARISWVRQEGMHLTLKFLGEVDEPLLEKVKALLQEVGAVSRPFLLKVRGTGVFPPGARNPRVLWVGVEEDPALGELQARLESSLKKLGFPREDRPFHPHLTLGRVKSPGDLRLVLAELEKRRDDVFGEMMARTIILFRSTLKATGAEYAPLIESRLQ
jgi:2'-5' RNA ligase